MRIDFNFRNLEPTEAIKAYAADKLSKLNKYVRGSVDAAVTFSVERHLHCVDVSLNVDGERHQGREEQEDMYASIDLVVDKIQRQLNRAHEQSTNHRRGPQPDG
ncbi:MAG: ribosome-associated translation inhibitor RaiA [Myxococcales bacterium]|nr:ribosome-associated translation inhibitor RaiA [Myxococcales bacterium]